MYKVGDIVLLREDVDSIYSRSLHKGDWYVVLGVMEYGGSQFISIKDEDRVATWYLSSISPLYFLTVVNVLSRERTICLKLGVL